MLLMNLVVTELAMSVYGIPIDWLGKICSNIQIKEKKKEFDTLNEIKLAMSVYGIPIDWLGKTPLDISFIFIWHLYPLSMASQLTG